MSQLDSRQICAALLIAASVIACRTAEPAPDSTPISRLPKERSNQEIAAANIVAPLATTTPGSTQAGAGTPAKSNSPVHGYVSTRYRARTTGGAHDQDVDTVLGLDIGDATKDRVTGHLMARASADLDGTSSTDPFFSLNDTSDHGLSARLYSAWADIRPAEPRTALVERWRLGRQLDYLTPEFALFDGVSAQTRMLGKHQFQAGIYGGVPVHLYESSSQGDVLYGAFAQGHAWQDARVRADWMHLEDETRLAKHDNDLLSLEAWQTVSSRLQLEGKYTHLEQEPRDLRAQASWYDVKRELTIFLSYFELLRTQHSLALEADPFSTTLLEEFPYRQARLLVSKTLYEFLLLQGGADVRRVSDSSDIGQFNRDFERGFLTTTLSDILPLDLSLSLTGEVWNSPDSDIETWGFDVSRQFQRRVDASLGSYYSLFKYDYFQVVERDDVRTYYITLRWKENSAATFDVRYEFEDSDLGDFQTFRVGAKWQF